MVDQNNGLVVVHSLAFHGANICLDSAFGADDIYLKKPQHDAPAYNIDGAVFNSYYMSGNEGGRVDRSMPFDTQRLQDRNKPLIAHLQERKLHLKDNDEQRLMVFGLDQSYIWDDQLSRTTLQQQKTDSSFSAIGDLSECCNIPVDTFLLSDAYGDLKPGTSFARALRVIRREKAPEEEKHANWIYDKSQISVAYAQAQYLANKNPRKKIFYNVYLGDRETLSALYDFFNTNKNLLPSIVTLCLHLYDGEFQTLENVEDIQGSGIIDPYYYHTIRNIENARNVECQKHFGENTFDMSRDLDVVTWIYRRDAYIAKMRKAPAKRRSYLYNFFALLGLAGAFVVKFIPSLTPPVWLFWTAIGVGALGALRLIYTILSPCVRWARGAQQRRLKRRNHNNEFNQSKTHHPRFVGRIPTGKNETTANKLRQPLNSDPLAKKTRLKTR